MDTSNSPGIYGMARPSFAASRYRRRATGGEGAGSMQIAVLGIDLGKNSCSVVGTGRERARSCCDGGCAGRRGRARGRAAGLRGGDGGLLRGASSRPGASGPRSRGAADVAGVRPALREGAEERRPGRGGDRRGGDAADDAVRGAEERGAARPADAAPGALAAGGRADGADQPAARRCCSSAASPSRRGGASWSCTLADD